MSIIGGGPFDSGPPRPMDEWTDNSQHLYSDIGGENPDVLNDIYAQTLYEIGYIELQHGSEIRMGAREALADYLMETYGIDFDDVFDWEAWREAYGTD